MTLEDLGELSDAATEYRAAATVFEQLCEAQPANTEHQRNLAASYGNLANVQIRLGQRAEGIATYRASATGSNRSSTNAPRMPSRRCIWR